ncbi:hypothetical protein PC9H_010032 [Pleurotus ostreatus]|uniref:F-box domain-containing protein n=1 Tax=Pleurotus ostreatus TaxID=5322 RepID=A0A8H7DSN1_PLEOS|nr:uncharacterized protein PC9H_010032 [Pleurotus ostreatus]KAF7424721.1 hypothetical protein PC9H_010032 [Pleurotus ostreatus]
MGYSSTFGSSSIGFGSPLKLQSSLFVTSRRPSIPLSPTLLPLVSFSSHQKSVEGKPSVACTPALVHQLPVEILCDIFTYCHANASGEECGPKVTISHVCRRWRTIVLCMPMLWTRISLKHSTKGSIERVAAYLRRSGSCTISVSILALHLSEDSVPSNLWALLHEHLNRLDSLKLELRGSLRKPVEHLAGCQYPLLKDLDLRLQSCPGGEVDALFKAFQGAPLSSLVWRGEESIPKNAPWSMLTKVVITGSYTLGDISTLLSQCHAAQEFSVDTISGDGVVPAAITSLPSLRTLSVYTFVNISRLLENLHLPALDKVSIHNLLRPGVGRGWRSLESLLRRSECTLTKMVVWDKSLDDDQFIQLLRIPGLQKLSDLQILHPSISNDVLRVLSSDTAGSCILPDLAVLNLTSCHSDDGVLKQVLAPRFKTEASTKPLDRYTPQDSI